ncbi:MAG: AMP-binding protein, partial [Proteobacteria bacterium]|nr:AMP-binding protein [Pseudomonadota bacterium]
MAEVGAGPRVQAGAMTVAGLLETGAAGDVALAAPGRAALTFRGLREHLAKTSTALNAAGVGRGDRVAIVLPNGPEMASAFLSVAASASTAPLNPAYREDEFDFYLSDLRAKALIVEAGSETPALAVARRQGIAVLELHPEADGPAGLFTLAGDGPGGTPATGGFAEPGDEALVLHTSGTTSRPKIVPLTQTNICASARNIRQTLTLSPGDRCLNIMPLFHIHGLIAATLSALGAGGRVFCSPGFNALRFF